MKRLSVSFFIVFSFFFSNLCFADEINEPIVLSEPSITHNESFWSNLSGYFTQQVKWVDGKLAEFAHDILEKNDDIRRSNIDIRKNLLGFDELNISIDETLRKLEQRCSVSIPLEFWEKYTESICKDELLNIPTDSLGVSQFKLQSNNKLKQKQLKNNDAISLALPFIKKIKDLHTIDVAKKTADWAQKKALYAALKNHLHPAAYPWYKKATRWGGYITVLFAGPYIGNKLYQKLLSHYFKRPSVTKKEIIKQIEILQEECDKKLALLEEITSKKLRVSLQKSIETLEKELETLEKQMLSRQKPSKMRIAMGIATHASMIAMTTYLFYTIFKKFDDHYLAPSPLALEMNNVDLAAFLTEYKNATPEEILKALEQEKIALINENFVLEQLQTILDGLNNKKEELTHYIEHLKSLIKSKINISEGLDDAAENFEGIKPKIILGQLI